MAAFLPMLTESGPNAAFPHAIGFVVVLCLIFSLVESKLILPAHLAHMPPEPATSNGVLTKIRRCLNNGLNHWVQNYYKPFLKSALHYRYTVLIVFVGLIVLTAMMFKTGNIKYINFPKIPHDYVRIKVEMNSDASEQSTLDTVLKIDQVITQVENAIESEHNQKMVDSVMIRLTGRTSAEIQTRITRHQTVHHY